MYAFMVNQETFVQLEQELYFCDDFINYYVIV